MVGTYTHICALHTLAKVSYYTPIKNEEAKNCASPLTMFALACVQSNARCGKCIDVNEQNNEIWFAGDQKATKDAHSKSLFFFFWFESKFHSLDSPLWSTVFSGLLSLWRKIKWRHQIHRQENMHYLVVSRSFGSDIHHTNSILNRM